MSEQSVCQKKYQASAHYIHRKISGADVLISVGTNIADFNGYIEINESAATLWEKLQTPCGTEDLIELLKEKYQIQDELAEQDVLEFLDLLEEHNMVVIQ